VGAAVAGIMKTMLLDEYSSCNAAGRSRRFAERCHRRCDSLAG